MKKRTLLTVDDDVTVNILVENVFSLHEYQVVAASTGVEALEKIHQIQPDVILLDIVMPEMDGYETCARIKAIPDFLHTPVIMLTSHDDVEAVENAYQCGASDFISKPINWPVLTHRVSYALRAATAFANEHEAARLSRAIDISPTEVFIFDGESLRIRSANTSARNNLGYSTAQINVLALQDLVAPPMPKDLVARVRSLKAAEQVRITLDLQRANGSRYPVEGFVIHSLEGGSLCYIGILQDISERKRAEAELHQLAFYDALTGLPNRRLLQIHVEQALALASRSELRCAVCIMDLDGFKRINDTLGHKVGDLLLKEVSHRLSRLVRKADTVVHETPADGGASNSQVARLGGDEFLLLLGQFEDAAVPARVANRVLNDVSLPYLIQGTHLHITGSIGIALYPEDGANIDELMMHADTAMYKAKQEGKNSYAFFTEKSRDYTAKRFTLESELHNALQHRQFELHYQPQLDSALTHIVAAEALIRWRHPSRGLLCPNEFIAVAEETGLIVRIGEWVLQEAVDQLVRWSASVPDSFKIAVNVSGYQVRDEAFVNLISRSLSNAPVARNRLVLELTESSLMTHAQDSIAWLHAVKETGVEIAIDDFGTGYSSLSYLKKFPIDYLKIDRSFVKKMESNQESEAIVRAIFQMAQALGINLTVEGVETRAELSAIQSMGECLVQGWLVSKALPADMFSEFFHNYPSSVRSQGSSL